VAGRALGEVFRQLAITEGGEANIAWVVSGLGYAQQPASTAARPLQTSTTQSSPGKSLRCGNFRRLPWLIRTCIDDFASAHKRLGEVVPDIGRRDADASRVEREQAARAVALAAWDTTGLLHSIGQLVSTSAGRRRTGGSERQSPV
jgi:hypothetical protein